MLFVLLENLPKVSGSFIQDWLYMWWDEQRWDDEIRMYNELGMKYIILQSIGAEAWIIDDPSKPEYDWTNYKLDTTYDSNNRIDYPSKTFPDLFYNNHDSLQMMFKSCKKYGIQAFIGPKYDVRFWKYGWIENQLDYFDTWYAHDIEEKRKVFTKIWNQYSEFHDQIAGFYFDNEYWNFGDPCVKPEKRQIWANHYGTFLSEFDTLVSDITNGQKPILLSPFKNYNMTTSTQYKEWLKVMLKTANLRSNAIFAPQDSMGGWYSQKIEELRNWSESEKEACDYAGIRYWINNENFRDPPLPPTATIDEYIRQIEESDSAETHIMFSISHYGNNNSETEADKVFYQGLKEYIDSLQVQEETSSSEILQNSSNSDDSFQPSNNDDSLQPWETALIVIGVIAAVAVIGVAAFLIFRKRNHASSDSAVHV